ncbi:MAG TPA: L,D-transpeptidase family protein [Thermodesulfovibrionales bacterium]|nr:L,D-transpeptidase family protein [Thermodesulfovibrionales bacterium]
MTQIKLITKEIIVLLLTFVFLCTQALSSERSSSVQISPPGLSLLIKKRIAEGRAPLGTVIGGEQIYAEVLVQSFYKGRNYQPAWSQDGHLIQTESLIMAVEEAYGDGLTPDYYHLGLIRSLVDKVTKEVSPDPTRLADLDILLTDTFLTLGCHLSAGCVNPVTIEAEWFAKRGSVDVSSVLEQALRKKQIREALMRLRPVQASYERLRQVLARYRELSLRGEWPLVSGGSLLKEGSTSDRVAELRKRLSFSGDLAADVAKEGDFFDEKLKQSLIIFQKRHGLKADGVLGSATINALNVPLRQRTRQIELNMERLRWILGNVEQRSIVVNIADFQLDVMESGKSILSMKVVVGKPYRRTPVFTAKMTHIVINPPWNIPDRIAREEILKKIKNDPHYLAEQNIKVLRGWGSRQEEIDPETIDWSEITPKTLPYHFRQEPGPLNPLGRLKFMFPNSFDVYLHDTPAKRLFSENVRTFSHGCTRIEKPIELGEYVMRDNSGWTREVLLNEIEEGTEKKVLISRPLNVHFLYLTAWVDEGGTLQFRNDIYGRDNSLDEALRKKPSLH